MPTMRHSICALAVLALLAAAVPALASEADRAEYRAEVEPICQANTQANERIFAGVHKMVKQGRLKAAAAQFAKAAAALKKTLAELRAVPQPPGEEARLAKWLKHVGIEASLFETVAKDLRAGKKAAAQRLVVRLVHNANLANSMVVAFEFHYCRLETSRFT